MITLAENGSHDAEEPGESPVNDDDGAQFGACDWVTTTIAFGPRRRSRERALLASLISLRPSAGRSECHGCERQ